MSEISTGSEVSAIDIVRKTSTTENGTNTNARAFGSVLLILAVVAGMYAIIQPMNQQMDYLKEEIVAVRNQLSMHEQVERRNDTQITAELSAAKEKFIKSESNFHEHGRRIESIEEWRTWWNRERMSDMQGLSERITSLERMVFGDTKE